MFTKDKKVIAWFPAVIWMGVIFYLSHQPAQTSSELSSGITDLVVHFLAIFFPLEFDVESIHFYIRKSAHFTAYLLLGMFVLFALRQMRWKRLVIAVCICVLYAMSDEFHQLFVPGRSGEIRDVFIDSIGACVGIGGYYIGSKIVTFLRKK